MDAIKQTGSDLIKTSDPLLLHLFVKISLREALYPAFFFLATSSALGAYYEMEFLVYCLDGATMQAYAKAAAQAKLFTREPMR
ncbi:hypothetical protein LOK74_16765 [Brevibacillus humidisoli]|uniref:hypothetical protein n=1 Tax=Brevibacillus humidisoli TaxID=2895522 RepID=UPI001E35B239|nr:hypothetical protein [Brevibacillus humidisoli]UFJ39695.1 hypothetical protein LOK74_16765 [Brevibacillus humidisoli]